mmetsp:Transcript_28992/g.67176  ORF Transcript_28992/g.67176 Transcript_28992/m.67176 type:complete len:538 (+) Transcript_28992:86-1699(+)|eukprot:CAMPEP_0114555376 /NCGR_PEP_ID=MMETSP0114-20121206/8717_1 /TAXON_ID=31324 /ORGANISM="Goniomonas sp, Strain m" /LENGTH=537 /DNA_ID=CAMNT_0001740499 /DNA_START=86 /DNA_END=1699 /DNA_ORIENTATION=-
MESEREKRKLEAVLKQFEAQGQEKKARMPKVTVPSGVWTEGVVKGKTFRPTAEEFEDPMRYLKSIAAEAGRYGVVRIRPPKSFARSTVFQPECQTKDKLFSTRVQKIRSKVLLDQKRSVAWQIELETARRNSFEEIRQLAKTTHALRLGKDPGHTKARTVEQLFWTSIAEHETFQVQYASDVEGSFCSAGQFGKWDLRSISSLPGGLLRFIDFNIPGVNSPMLYLGVLFSMFGWHHEDNELYSISFLHRGAPKTWYGIPGARADAFRDLVDSKVLPKMRNAQPNTDVLALKTTMVSPSAVARAGIPISRLRQRAGDFIVTFPTAYHCGFSHGFTVAEAVNLALPDWLPCGVHSVARYRSMARLSVLDLERLIITAGAEGIGGNALERLVSWQRDALASLRAMEVPMTAMSEENKLYLVLCRVCKHILHLCQVGCDCHPEEAYCAEHASECECPHRRAVLRYTQAHMDSLVPSGAAVAQAQQLRLELPKGDADTFLFGEAPSAEHPSPFRAMSAGAPASSKGSSYTVSRSVSPSASTS